jgi:hypothetical protein
VLHTILFNIVQIVDLKMNEITEYFDYNYVDKRNIALSRKSVRDIPDEQRVDEMSYLNMVLLHDMSAIELRPELERLHKELSDDYFKDH